MYLLQLTSLEDLSFLAAAQPYDTLWRVADMALVIFETLQILPRSQRPQYRIETADTCQTVLANIQKFGKRRLSGEGWKQIERLTNIMAQVQVHAKSEANFERHLSVLKQAIKERPAAVVPVGSGQNVSTNMGLLYGMNVGDGGSITFGPSVREDEHSPESNENVMIGGEAGSDDMHQPNEIITAEEEAPLKPGEEPYVQDVPQKETHCTRELKEDDDDLGCTIF